MPRYDFKCRSCERTTPHTTSIDVHEIVCGACGGTADKQFPAPNFTIKGYSAKTGYASKEERGKD